MLLKIKLSEGVRDTSSPFLLLLVKRVSLKISEDYGSGGYNPFKLDEMPFVKNYIYYNDEGNVIKSNY